MQDELFEFDQKQLICGIDEAGRGPLAGPVSAAACILGDDFPIDILHDSKKMSAKQRDEAMKVIKEKALCYAVCFVEHDEIDRINILNATMKCMKMALDEVCEKIRPDLVLIDGNRCPEGIEISHRAEIRGDDRIPEIMAASILAKTARDNVMKEYAKKYPQYHYERHMGYPTKLHREMIMKYGPSPIQRLTFTVKKV